MATACGAGTPVFAQEQEEAATGLDEIIVTARFREEKLQETPIAITAITADELQSRGMQNAFEIAYTVPNASLRPAQAAFGASMSAYIRGIGQYDFLPEFEPGVAIYFDDVLHPVTFASSIDLMDLERVEVLRGPQGTLFGRGSIGGAIRYISKPPQGDETGDIQCHLRRLQPHRHPRQLRLQAFRDGVCPRERRREEARRLPERLRLRLQESRCSPVTATASEPTVRTWTRRRTWSRPAALPTTPSPFRGARRIAAPVARSARRVARM